NGRTGGHALKNTGEDLDDVVLAALRGEARGAGFAAIKVALQVFCRQRQARRAAVDHGTQRRPVALAKGRHREKLAETVARHEFFAGSGCQEKGAHYSPCVGSLLCAAHSNKTNLFFLYVECALRIPEGVTHGHSRTAGLSRRR